MKRASVVAVLVLAYLILCGCLYRGDGAFKRIGDSDYKAKLSVMNIFVAADGRPTLVNGVVLLEDQITPLKYTNIVLKRKDASAVVAKAQTDHVGRFNLSAILPKDRYVLEINSPEYIAVKEITVEPDRMNSHQLSAYRR